MLCEPDTRKRGIRWWGWVAIFSSAILTTLLWWLLRRRVEKESIPAATIEITAPSRGIEIGIGETTPAAKPAPPTPDDLKRIEGIGPKISSVFQAAGITTFAQLAATDADQLRRILKGAGIRIADPSTWPEQASLAAADKWDALRALQAELKGGRRV
jgi:predicted flap endonuclease-1-like 5' DNA nuclease